MGSEEEYLAYFSKSHEKLHERKDSVFFIDSEYMLTWKRTFLFSYWFCLSAVIFTSPTLSSIPNVFLIIINAIMQLTQREEVAKKSQSIIITLTAVICFL
jgi:hypothetical protein